MDGALDYIWGPIEDYGYTEYCAYNMYMEENAVNENDIFVYASVGRRR